MGACSICITIPPLGVLYKVKTVYINSPLSQVKKELKQEFDGAEGIDDDGPAKEEDGEPLSLAQRLNLNAAKPKPKQQRKPAGTGAGAGPGPGPGPGPGAGAGLGAGAGRARGRGRGEFVWVNFSLTTG